MQFAFFNLHFAIAPLPALLFVAALLGHAALWVGFVNRVHSTGWPRWLVKIVSALGHAMLAVVPLAYGALGWFSGHTPCQWLAQSWAMPLLAAYAVACWLLLMIATGNWLKRHWFTKPPALLRSHRSTVVDVPARLGFSPQVGFKAKLLSHVPGNQVLRPAIEEYEFALPRLPAALDGLTIVQLTDLHFTGRIGVEFFAEMVRETNVLRPDLICLCGDIIDELRCCDWFAATLAKLQATHGVYFVLGNHDWFTSDVPRVRRLLTAAGLVDLGGRWQRLEIRGAEVILAGNELPWFAPAADMQTCPPRSTAVEQFRLLLAHTPDQFAWARRWDFDLMLAGHTHGGQIRLPLIGPIFSPSWHGVQYASGTFYRTPTLLHVSRGLSAELPLRLNCRPELTKIILRRE